MGAFNELIISDEEGGEIKIQYKCGVVWQRVYHLNQPLEFEDNDRMRFGEHFIFGISEVHGLWKYYKLILKDGAFIDFSETTEREYEANLF